MDRDTPREAREVVVAVEAHQQPGVHFAPPQVGHRREPPLDEPTHQPVELPRRQVRERGDVDSLDSGRNRGQRLGCRIADAHELSCDTLWRGLREDELQALLQAVHGVEQRRRHQHREPRERRDPAQLPHLFRQVVGEGDVAQVRPAADALAGSGRSDRHPLKHGIEDERPDDRLRQRTVSSRPDRRHGPDGEHDIHVGIGQQSVHGPADAVQCRVGHTTLRRGQGDVEQRRGQVADLAFERRQKLVVALPRAVEDDADRARGALQLRVGGRRRHRRGQSDDGERESRSGHAVVPPRRDRRQATSRRSAKSARSQPKHYCSLRIIQPGICAQADARRPHQARAHRQPVAHLRVDTVAGMAPHIWCEPIPQAIRLPHSASAPPCACAPTTGPPAPSAPAGSTASGPHLIDSGDMPRPENPSASCTSSFRTCTSGHSPGLPAPCRASRGPARYP